MRKFCLISIVAIFSFININAQNVKFGAKTGVNFASTKGNDGPVDWDMRTSFHVGAVVEIPLSGKFSIQPELLYSAQGAKYDGKLILPEDVDDLFDLDHIVYKNNLDYLNLPIILKYYVIEGLSIEIGPQIGFLLSAKMEHEYSSEDGGSESGETDVKDGMKDIDFGLNFGAGYQLENGVNFSARYNHGFSNIYDGDAALLKSQKHNSVIQISIGYFF